MADGRQYCTFCVDGHLFGIDVLQVQEIIRHQPMTRVPLAPAVVRGLINLRGQIVTAIDLRRRMGMSERAADALPVNVVLQTDDGAVSLLVDEIGDVLDVAEGTFERPPATLQGAARDLIAGVFKLDGRLLMILDAERTADVAAEPRELQRIES